MMTTRPSITRPGRLGWRPAAVVAMLILASFALPGRSLAAEAGMVKTAVGGAWVERAGVRTPARVGDTVREADVIVTGADGSVGITFADNSRMSIGPNSVLVIDRFVFDSTTHGGAFETSLGKGTLNAVSGNLTRQSPDAMKVKTPTAVLGVRGTEFFVRAGTTE